MSVRLKPSGLVKSLRAGRRDGERWVTDENADAWLREPGLTPPLALRHVRVHVAVHPDLDGERGGEAEQQRLVYRHAPTQHGPRV